MNTSNTSKVFSLVFFCLVALPAAILAQSGGDRFTATLANPVGGGTSPVMIHIDRYFFAAAKVTLTAGTVDIESYSPQPLRLLGVEKR